MTSVEQREDKVEAGRATANAAASAARTLSLRVVPMEQVVPHESHHPRRVADLSARLVAEGRLSNPPIAAALNGKYVVLDGATRLASFRHLGYPHIILQVVDLHHKDLRLDTWYHGIRGSSVDGLLESLSEVENLRLTPYAPEALARLTFGAGMLGYLITSDRRGFLLEAVPDPSGRAAPPVQGSAAWLDVFNHVVERYGAWGNVERTLATEVEVLAAQYPDLVALVVFPHFTPEMIVRLAVEGRTVPAGITRFVIPGRILRLNAPLAPLINGEPLEVKEAWLDALIQEKFARRQVRYYAEPVVLLDE